MWNKSNQKLNQKIQPKTINKESTISHIMDCTELWASLKQLWLLEAPPSIPTIGPWEPAATGGILLPPKLQKHMEVPARLKFDPQFPTKVFANRRKSGTRRKVPFADLPREIWTKKITHLPICRGSPKFYVFLSSMAIFSNTRNCTRLQKKHKTWFGHEPKAEHRNSNTKTAKKKCFLFAGCDGSWRYWQQKP